MQKLKNGKPSQRWKKWRATVGLVSDQLTLPVLLTWVPTANLFTALTWTVLLWSSVWCHKTHSSNRSISFEQLQIRNTAIAIHWHIRSLYKTFYTKVYTKHLRDCSYLDNTSRIHQQTSSVGDDRIDRVDCSDRNVCNSSVVKIYVSTFLS